MTEYIVYALPHEKYCGMTKNAERRMYLHSNDYGTNTDDWYILRTCYTREEALLWEARYHATGWKGSKGKRVMVNGRVFANVLHASKETGIPRRTIHNRLNNPTSKRYKHQDLEVKWIDNEPNKKSLHNR